MASTGMLMLHAAIARQEKLEQPNSTNGCDTVGSGQCSVVNLVVIDIALLFFAVLQEDQHQSLATAKLSGYGV